MKNVTGLSDGQRRRMRDAELATTKTIIARMDKLASSLLAVPRAQWSPAVVARLLNDFETVVLMRRGGADALSTSVGQSVLRFMARLMEPIISTPKHGARALLGLKNPTGRPRHDRDLIRDFYGLARRRGHDRQGALGLTARAFPGQRDPDTEDLTSIEKHVAGVTADWVHPELEEAIEVVLALGGVVPPPRK